MSLFDQRQNHVAITAFYALTLTKFDMALHSHASCEIMYVKKGACLIETAHETRSLYEGDFVFLDAYAPHRLYVNSSSPCSILNLEFCLEPQGDLSLAAVRNSSQTLRHAQPLPGNLLFAHDTRKLKQPLEDLIQCLTAAPNQTETSENDLLIALLFQQCLLELSYYFNIKQQPSLSPYLEKATAYIKEHLNEDLRVPAIAQAAGINKSYLHALFAEQLNETISSYINRKRLEQARFLLANSDLSVTEVAFQVGYNSRQHFSSTFTKFYQQSPQAYQLNKQSLEYLHANKGQYIKEANQWTMHHMKD